MQAFLLASLILVVLDLASGAACRPCPHTGPRSDAIVMAQYLDWKYWTMGTLVEQINGSLFTHIAIDEISPDSGVCTPTFAATDIDRRFGQNALGDDALDPFAGLYNQLRRLKLRFPHLRTVMRVGGWSNNVNFSRIAADSNASATLASSCANMMTTYAFDAINIDWRNLLFLSFSFNSY